METSLRGCSAESLLIGRGRVASMLRIMTSATVLMIAACSPTVETPQAGPEVGSRGSPR